MGETEALGGPLAFPARVAELGAAPRNSDSRAWWNNRGVQATSQCGWNVSSSCYKAPRAMTKMSREHTPLLLKVGVLTSFSPQWKGGQLGEPQGGSVRLRTEGHYGWLLTEARERASPRLTGASGLNCPHLRFWSGPADRSGLACAGRGGRSQLSSPALPSPHPKVVPLPKAGRCRRPREQAVKRVCVTRASPRQSWHGKGWGSAFPFVKVRKLRLREQWGRPPTS